ncbi:DUF202 domain-containing protein [Naasia sp. SYSU D00948]|uniref:DUF202 domain-containing protein n=1 Tax=Naasia sp. SYSU D00948 TaxID=2817379 RepID=UPI001B312907|nr:DUF202 domain-containing protein [Naasia sp. SYSU D00948]
MSADRPFDAGLQPERTLLAWRRTALALGVGSVVGARLALPVLGAAAVGIGVAGAASALVAYVLAARRYRRQHRALTAEEELPGGGLALAALAAAAAVLAAGGLAYVLMLSGRS